MLILTRKNQEVIHIGDEIWIKILSFTPHYVRLGIEAPRNMPVHRQEIYHKVLQERLAKAPIMEEEYAIGM